MCTSSKRWSAKPSPSLNWRPPPFWRNHMTPRVLFLDIETAPAIGYFWGHTYQTDIIKVLRPQFILSYSYKWMGGDKIHFKGLPDYPSYKENLENDRFLLGDL